MMQSNESLGALTLSEIAKIAIGLVCLEPGLAGPARQIGLSVGRRLATNRGFQGPTFSTALEALCEMCRDTGFVNCQPLETTSELEARFRLENCESVLGCCIPGCGRQVCAFDEGLFEGFLQEIACDPTISVTEHACLGKGDISCDFTITWGNHSLVR